MPQTRKTRAHGQEFGHENEEHSMTNFHGSSLVGWAVNLKSY